MLQENKIIELLPQVLSGDRLIEELGYLPAYNETIIEQSQASRLLALSDIYRVYVPCYTDILSQIWEQKPARKERKECQKSAVKFFASKTSP